MQAKQAWLRHKREPVLHTDRAEMVKLLLGAGAKAVGKDSWNRSALYVLVSQYGVDVVKAALVRALARAASSSGALAMQ